MVMFAINLTAFYLFGWFYVLADWYGFLDQYAIRSGKHRVADIQKQWAAIKNATFDTFLVQPALFYFIFPYIIQPNISFDKEKSPALLEGVRDWIYLSFIFSTSLFFIHGGMHKIPFLYKYVHKKHHTFYDTVGFAAQYSHPVEGLFSACHILFGIYFVKPHFSTFCIYIFTLLVEIVDAHCGYDVPWKFIYPWSDVYPWGSGARAHDYHHSHNIGIYGGGVFGLWDRLFGSDFDYRQFENKRA